MLTGLFDSVGLHTNTNKMVVMVCQHCIMYGRHLEADYTRRMMGVRPSFHERHQERVRWPDCATDLVAGFLAEKHQAHHGTIWVLQWEDNPPPPDPGLYSISFPRVTRFLECPLGGCGGRALPCTNLRIYFIHCNMRDMMKILEGGNRPQNF